MTVCELKNLQEQCNGCGACANVCPVNAIEMKPDSEGFYYPVINRELCVDCNKCVNTCYIEKQLVNKCYDKEAYVYCGLDEVRNRSSSGGLFYAVASETLKSGGVVFGAVYDANKHIVIHSSTELVELESLMRSKYVQSEVSDVYRQVKMFLESNRKVLFSGTPCQVYGLKSFLGQEYENLLTMDFVCHGVPSTGIFKDMVEDHISKRKSNVIDVTFREKDFGWRKLILKIYFENGEVVKYEPKDKGYYYFFYFLNNIILRKSCYSCRFPGSQNADITMMDHWSSKGDDNKGISACIVNSEKGKNILFLAGGDRLGIIDIKHLQSTMTSHEQMGTYRRNRVFRNMFMQAYIQKGLQFVVTKYYSISKLVIVSVEKIATIGGKIKIGIKRLLGK